LRAGDGGDAAESGYRSGRYALALAHLGTPLQLSRSGGWLLRRPIGDSGFEDARGPYPILVCRDWSQVRADLESLPSTLASVTLVADPLGEWTAEGLKAAFPDVARPFKTHYMTDLREDLGRITARHHQRAARRALRHVSVEVCASPAEARADWIRLYGNLVVRHGIVGLAAFPEDSLSKQLDVPGLMLVRVRRGEATVGLVLWYLDGSVARYHLAAYSPEGYDIGASHAAFWFSLSELQRLGLTWAHLGGSAGLAMTQDGLDRFKRGWASGTCTAWLCGRILRQDIYEQLTARAGGASRGYFPAYRTPDGNP